MTARYFAFYVMPAHTTARFDVYILHTISHRDADLSCCGFLDLIGFEYMRIFIYSICIVVTGTRDSIDKSCCVGLKKNDLRLIVSATIMIIAEIKA
jgi:hypothetical protein